MFAVLSVQGQVIKLASIAPENSPFGRTLNQLAADIRSSTNGRVRLRIYHNAVQGDEADIIRKMRIGQLHAGLFSSSGLDYVSRDFLAISMPFLVRTDGELHFVLNSIRPYLESKLRNEGLEVLALAPAGWVRFFGRRPIRYPKDLKAQRLAANPTQEAFIQVFKLLGYKPIPVDFSETLTALNSGLIDAFYTSPLVAAGYQWFAQAPNMPDLKVAPILGAVVISDRGWRMIPDRFKPGIEEAMGRAEERMQTALLELEETAIETMKEFGLEVTPVSEDAREAWIADFEKNLELTAGSVYSREILDRIQTRLEEARSRE
jgi:TRAP-type C4-dicarboxylate transport system substrate-binding protein